jgi:orotate phosphoribosyltransferase
MSKMQLLSIELLFKALFVFGKGTLKSAISSNPFLQIKNENATSTIKKYIGEELDICLMADMMLGLGLRDQC